MPLGTPARDDWERLFTRTLSEKKGQSPPNRSAFSASALWMVIFGLCATLIGFARPNSAQSRPEIEPTATSAPPSESANVKKPTVAKSNDKSDVRRPLAFYTDQIQGHLFGEPQPAPVPQKKKVKPVPPPAQIIPPMPINPFADWSYTGTVHIGDKIEALIENSKTKEGQYLTIGANFLGANVKQITDQMVMLNANGKMSTLPKSSNITVTPLDKSADILSASQQQPNMPNMPNQPGAPGAMPNAPGNLPGMTQGSPPNLNGYTITPRRRRVRNR